MNIYYRIWADAIVFERTKHGHMRNWKVFTLIPISLVQGLNLLAIFILIGFLTGNFANLFFEIDIFPGSMLDSFVSGSITMILPFLLLNYILVFWNKRYEKIIENYPFKNGKLYLLYFLISIGLFLGPLIIGLIIGKI